MHVICRGVQAIELFGDDELLPRQLPEGCRPRAKPAFVPKSAADPVPLLVIHGMKDTALLAIGHAGTWDKASKDTTIMMLPNAGISCSRMNPRW